MGLFSPERKGAKATDTSHLLAFQRLIEAGGGVTTIEDDIQAVKFRKNIWYTPQMVLT